MRYVFRAVVVAGFVLGLFLGFLLFDVHRAYAQTSTPTLVPTWVPPTVTPTPAATAVYTGATTYVWGCLLYGTGYAPVCTWGDYFEFNGNVSVGGPSGELLRWPSVGLDLVRYVLIFPADTKSVQATCSYDIEAYGFAGVSGDGYQATAGAGAGGVSSRYRVFIDGVEKTNIPLNGIQVSDVSATGQKYDSEFETFDIEWRLAAGQTWFSSFPGSYGDYSLFPRFSGYGSCNTVGGSEVYCSATSRMACKIGQVERVDGSTYVPSTQPVGDYGTPTPVPSWGATPWASDPWVPVANPEPIGLEVTPGELECVTLLPAVGFPDVTIAGNTYSLDFPGASICLEQYNVSLEMLGVDFGVLVVTVVTLGGIGVVYGVFKRG